MKLPSSLVKFICFASPVKLSCELWKYVCELKVHVSIKVYKGVWHDKHPTTHQQCKLWQLFGWPKRNHAEDMPSIFQLKAKGDKGSRGQATYPTFRSSLGCKKMIQIQMQLPHKLQISVLGEI